MSLKHIISVITQSANIVVEEPPVDPEPRDDTATDGKQAWLIIGDSIAQGRAEGPGPTPDTGTVFEWIDSVTDNMVEVGASDLTEAVDGSPWPRFAIDYYNATGKKPALINQGFGGSTFAADGVDVNDWSTTGSRYNPTKVTANSCLAALGVTQLRGIIMILGINDARGDVPLVDVEAAIDSLFSRLQTDFPDTPTYVVNIGRHEGDWSDALTLGIRAKLAAKATELDHVFIAYDLRDIATDHPEEYNADDLHLLIAGDNRVGAATAIFVIANP